jgi:hypothetical protein
MKNAYEAAVEKTFIKSIRSVFLVDDAFPTFADMFKSRTTLKRYKEQERANRLYQAFRKYHLPCDIENSFRPSDTKLVERMRKCDLIVLDFHLNGGDDDSEKALNILRHLADSDHFNTVIVYTKKPELNEVWLEIAANLRPDLSQPLDVLTNHADAAAWWDTADPTAIEIPSEDALASYLLGDIDNVERTERRRLIACIREAGAKTKLDVLLEALLRHHVGCRQISVKHRQQREPEVRARMLQGRFEKGRPYWLQCRGCFVAIVQKTEIENGTEADFLVQSLRHALLDWKPSFLQLLISEIQNNLELESLAADPQTFSDAVRQVGLSHYLLRLIAEDDEESAVELIVDRIIETVRYKISADSKLRFFAHDVLSQRREEFKDKLKHEDQIERAKALAHVPIKVKSDEVLFFLNSFLSSEPFGRSRLTTGTVFRHEKNYWMVMSPACDLTSRPPRGSQLWMKAMHPIRALLAVNLKCVPIDTALKEAIHGRHAFLNPGTDQIAVEIVNELTSAPSPEMFFALNAGRVDAKNGRMRFRGFRVCRSGPEKRLQQKFSKPTDFLVIGQLRANYASRILQFTGAHLARIGVDFFNMEKRDSI